MQIGIVGLQNSGKTTLFQTLTGQVTDTPKADGSRGVVRVPDKRLDLLTEMFNPQKKVNAILEFIDIPGLQVADTGKVKITSDFLNKVKNNDALLHVVRQFQNDAVPHPEDSIDPVRDIEFLETEFLLNDMAMIENRLQKIEKDVQKSKSDQLVRELPVFKKLMEHISNEVPLRLLDLDENERKVISGYQFLTIKPLIIGLNLDENAKDKADELVASINTRFEKSQLIVIPFFAQFELELANLSEEEASVFMEDMGITESALSRIIRRSYELLGLQSFFTVGEDECRAWTIKVNDTAQDAAGVIHTDFYAKFIRAEVVHYEDLLKFQTFAKCKEAGVWRLEGKEYIVKDGDILNIRHSG